ncbi:cellulose binding domain-containing protein [Jonesia denitrificans]|nr:cellulose binding domain-containing protein [Jonesia denitrificans]
MATATTATLAVSGVGLAATASPLATAPAAYSNGDSPSGYSWSNVEIVGGGFVPGIIFNQSEPGLVYARTDIGGAYRLDEESGRWKPLNDDLGWDQWSHSGILSLATDPVDPDRVYLAAGTYTTDWDPQNGAILRSTDRGNTWEKTMLPFKIGGNMPGRGMGERLAIDPNNNKILYLGTESGNGLWKSTDYGETWNKVTEFPNAGNYVQDPSYDYTADNQGVVWVTFDPTSANAGQTTQTIYVGVADKDNTVYRTTDGGSTWERIPGQPTGYLAQKGVLDHEGQQLYIATSDTGGPYDGSKGDVWRLDVTSGEWTQISPIPSSSEDAAFGYSGLTIDRNDPDTIMVNSQISWWPDMFIYRSTDRGETWSPIWEFDGYPNRLARFTHDYSGAPWLDFGRTVQPPESNPKLGWMTQSFEIDPHNSDRFYYGTGGGIYGGTNLTDWDTGGTVDISVKAQGIEETSVQDLAAPPGNVELYSALGDIGGFAHTDISTVPDSFHYSQPHHDTVSSIDFAEDKPDTVVRAGKSISSETESWIGVSTSGGSSWFAGNKPGDVTGPGTVAISADASAIVWAPEGGPARRSTTLGSTWSDLTGLPEGAQVASDREDPKKFYAYAQGKFYYSTNAGQSFTASAFTGLPTEGNVRFRAVPGHEGHVWLAGGTTGETYGMWRSTDGGVTWSQLTGVDEGDSIGFGKPETTGDYPIIYTSSKIGGERGIFRSDDEGATWHRINDDQNQWYWTGASITGDPDVVGRVYIGTNGRGIIVGDVDNYTPGDGSGGGEEPTDPDPEPTDPDPEPTDPDPEPTDPDPEPTDPDPEPTDPGTGPASCQVTYSSNDWNSGFTASVSVKNVSDSPIQGWSLAFAFSEGQTITNMWSADVSSSGSQVTVTNAAWNATINPGQSVQFGFNGTHSGSNPAPSSFTLNGTACASSS